MGRVKEAEPVGNTAEIVRLLKSGYSQAEVARTFEVTRQYIHIVRNRWKKLILQ